LESYSSVSKNPETVKKKTAKDIFEFEEADPDEIFADLEDVTTQAEVDDMVHVKVNFPLLNTTNLTKIMNFIASGILIGKVI